MSPTKVFLTGSTGYIGGSILSKLLESPEKYSISALVRNKEQGEALQKLGVTPIYGSLDDSAVLIEAAKAADAVVDAANADHLASAQAIVQGLKAKGDKKAVFLHTSGTAVLALEPVTEVPFDDENIARIHSIPLEAPHKDIDAWIFDNVDGITAAIIAPSTINGVGTGPFKKTSSQVIALAKASVARKRAGYVGDRKDVVWGNVNIHDLVDLYILVLDGLIYGKIDNGKEGGWYFGITQDHTWYKVAEIMASSLYKRGLVESDAVSPFEKQYVDGYLWGDFAKYVFGQDSKGVANRSRRIGWKPTRGNVYETMDEEIQYLIDNGELKPTSK